MKILILVSIICISITSLALGQDNKKSDDHTTKTIIEYARFMREEAQAHRDYLEKLYTIGGTIAGILVAIFAGIVTWINWKTKEEFKNQLKATMQSYSGPLIEESIKKFKNQISELYEKFEKDISHRNMVLEKQVHIFEHDLNRLKTQLQNNITGIVDLWNQKRIKDNDQVLSRLEEKKYNILWVDDYPENNLVPRRMFENVGIDIKLEKSTNATLRELRKSDYSLIISDMGRDKNHTAGLDLLEKLNEEEFRIPVIIYSSIGSIRRYGQQAKDLGALSSINGVSQLTNEVYKVLNIDPIKSNLL